MESETVTKPVRDLIKRFNGGDILLPQFQRDYVWRVNKIRNLLDSLFNDLPIGGFYLWRPTRNLADPKPHAFGTVKFTKAPSAYLIDGQQRLTSLEAAFGLFTGEDKRGAELQCYMDLAYQADHWKRVTGLFVTYAGHKGIARRIDAGDPTLIDIKTFFDGKIDQQLRSNTQGALAALPGWTTKRINSAMERYDRAHDMLGQSVPCTTVQADDLVAVELFRRLNQGGSPLREADIRAAELARGHAVSVLKRMREFVSEELPTRLGFGFSFAFRALVVFHRGSSQLRTLPADWTESAGPHKRSLAESWNATRKGMNHALRFIDEEVGWSRSALVASVNALIVLGFALDKGGVSPSATARQKYRRWLYLTALRNVFQGSVETTINRFIKAVRESKGDPASALVNALKKNEGRAIQSDELIQHAQLWGPATQVTYSWLVQKKIKDWTSDERLDALARSNSGSDLTVHHIFPRAVAIKSLPNPSDANCMANFAIVSRETNSYLKDKEPEEAMKMLSSDQLKRASFQFFSSEAGDRLKPDRYQEFRRWRAEKLADALNGELGLQ